MVFINCGTLKQQNFSHIQHVCVLPNWNINIAQSNVLTDYWTENGQWSTVISSYECIMI